MNSSYRDLLNPGRTRTWPYGTKKSVTVIFSSTDVLAVKEEATNEGFILVGQGGTPAAEGTKGEITFLEGGPTGGYWKFEPEPPRSLTQTERNKQCP